MIRMRSFLCAAMVALVAACSPPAAKAPPSNAPAATNPGAETLGKRYIDLLPQWVPIASTKDGGSIAYDLKGLKQPVDGIVEVLVQVTHGQPQEASIEEATVIRKVSYRQELVRLRYNCPARQFAIVGREVQDAAGKPVLKEATPEAALKPISGSGLATVAFNPACAER